MLCKPGYSQIRLQGSKPWRDTASIETTRASAARPETAAARCPWPQSLRFLIDLHRAQFRCKRGADACRDHNPCDQRPEFTGKSNAHQARNQPLRSEALQLIARQ